jgi:acyl-CoA synthetase (AMP-forming)/AMP-acid ligase II
MTPLYYGPAECTISALYQRLGSDDGEILEIVPIGRCLPSRQVALFDTYRQPVIPDGRSVREIYLGDVEVFHGYLNRPKESARVLVRLPKRDGVFYGTGDLGKINARGEIVFTGCVDFQIKLRGQRVELGEIEAVLTNSAVVKVSHDSEEYLVAYVQTKVPLDVNILHDECSKKLPLYMIPSLFVPIDTLPLNPSGKLDRNALPPPDFSLLLRSSDSTRTEERLRTDMEQRVASIW